MLMSSDEGKYENHVAEVHAWLAENVRVITQANELGLSDFTCDGSSGKFSVSVDGEVLEGRWQADGRAYLSDGVYL